MEGMLNIDWWIIGDRVNPFYVCAWTWVSYVCEQNDNNNINIIIIGIIITALFLA